MTLNLDTHSASPNGFNGHLGSPDSGVDSDKILDDMSDVLANKVSGILPEIIERLMAPVVELEAIKRKIFLTEKEVAIFFSIAPGTLRIDRCKGVGPQYMKDGRKILYSMDDVTEYYRKRTIRTRG